MSREDNQYVRMKVQRALSDMNASAETLLGMWRSA